MALIQFMCMPAEQIECCKKQDLRAAILLRMQLHHLAFETSKSVCHHKDLSNLSSQAFDLSDRFQRAERKVKLIKLNTIAWVHFIMKLRFLRLVGLEMGTEQP